MYKCFHGNNSINILLFDYIIALYPIVLTVFAYVGIELYDRSFRIVVYLTIPAKIFFRLFHRNWNPKTTILNTFSTFMLLAYSSLFPSISSSLSTHTTAVVRQFLIPQSFSLTQMSNFFHSEHIPYAVLTLSTILFLSSHHPCFCCSIRLNSLENY